MRRMALKKTAERIGLDQYFEEMIPVTESFNFPTEANAVAAYALRRKRFRTAASHYWKGFCSGPQRVHSLFGMCNVALKYLQEFLNR